MDRWESIATDEETPRTQKKRMKMEMEMKTRALTGRMTPDYFQEVTGA